VEYYKFFYNDAQFNYLLLTNGLFFSPLLICLSTNYNLFFHWSSRYWSVTLQNHLQQAKRATYVMLRVKEKGKKNENTMGW